MEVAISEPSAAAAIDKEKEQLRVKRKTLQAVLEQCQIALELLRTADAAAAADHLDAATDDDDDDEDKRHHHQDDSETAQLCNLLKSGVDSPNFLEKLGSIHVSDPQSNAAEEGSSWDVVSEKDLWEGGDAETDQESYVLVRQEDIMEGIACFTAAYLLSLNQTKDLTPNQLQEVKHSLQKREKENCRRPGMEAKLYTMWHPGEQLPLGYTKIQHCSGQLL